LRAQPNEEAFSWPSFSVRICPSGRLPSFSTE
jgi:hypothetical protein